jgi:hypothetical protein
VRGTVTVRIVDKASAPLAGMYVVFIDTDGTVTERMTDAAGLAQADVYPSATVTAVRARGMSYSLATVQALVPGDLVTLISAAPDVTSSEDPFSSRIVPLPGSDLVASPNGATKSGSIATFTTVAPHGLAAGDRVVIENVGVAGYNGSWTVASAPTPTTFTANLGTGNLASSGSIATGGATAMKALPLTLGFPAYAGADHYELRTRCGTVDVVSTPAALALPVACTAPAMDFEVLAKSSGNATLAWTELTNVMVSAGDTVTITDTWHAPSQLTAVFTNPAAMVTDAAIARFSPYVRGVPVAETSGAVTAILMLDVSKPTRAVMKTQLTCPSGADPSCLSTPVGSASQTITEAVDGTQPSYSLDLGATLLPWVKALYVPATTTLEITTSGSGTFDIFEANLRYTRGQNIYTWRVFGPLAQSVQFPALPATAPGNPTLLASDIMSSYQAFIGESDAINGYRDAIKNVFDALATAEASATASSKLYGGTKHRISQWN